MINFYITTVFRIRVMPIFITLSCYENVLILNTLSCSSGVHQNSLPVNLQYWARSCFLGDCYETAVQTIHRWARLVDLIFKDRLCLLLNLLYCLHSFCFFYVFLCSLSIMFIENQGFIGLGIPAPLLHLLFIRLSSHFKRQNVFS